MKRHTFDVPAESDRVRLDRFLTARAVDLTRSQVAAAVDRGDVLVNGALARKAGQKLFVGDAVVLRLRDPIPDRAEPEDIPLDIVHEDADLIVVHKPAGMVVHPAQGHWSGTLVNALLHHCHDLSGVGGVLRPGIVHRLDRETSGLMVVAKNDRAHRALAAQFKDRSAYRRYLAIVWGSARLAESGVFETLHGRHPTERKRFSSRVREGKEAVTRWRRLAQGEELSLVEAKLDTGRTHQIRVHFADSGRPVAGDPLYGAGRKPQKKATAAALKGLARQALHAYALGFAHPADGSRFTFRAAPPADLRRLLERLWPPEDLEGVLAPLLAPVDTPWEG